MTPFEMTIIKSFTFTMLPSDAIIIFIFHNNRPQTDHNHCHHHKAIQSIQQQCGANRGGQGMRFLIFRKISLLILKRRKFPSLCIKNGIESTPNRNYQFISF